MHRARALLVRLVPAVIMAAALAGLPHPAAAGVEGDMSLGVDLPGVGTVSFRSKSGVVAIVVAKAMRTNMQKTLSGKTPRSRPTLRTISSISARVFIIVPMQRASRGEKRRTSL